MLYPSLADDGLENLLMPETELERFLLKEPEFRIGFYWGKPRYGHPEGKVAYHVREVLDNIDKINLTEYERFVLRMVALCHDTFKYEEEKTILRGSRIHHGLLAKEYIQQFLDDDTVLTIIELHDEAFYSWRLSVLQNRQVESLYKLHRIFERTEGFLQLYYLFFKCDTRTGDKIQAPVAWFENVVEGIDFVDF